jgi:hypothetical protein
VQPVGATESLIVTQSLAARQRVILLGASNVARGLSVITETARRVAGRPLEIFAAVGRGRSYGQASRLLGRELPGIAQCGLWEALASRPRMTTSALVTDIGNDLLYDQPLDRIVEWIDFCLSRLAEVEARIVVTRLPLDNLPGLSERKFLLLKKIFFPGSRQTFPEVVDLVRALDERVVELARRYAAETISPPRAWYGFDSIHISARAMPRAWREILSLWSTAELSQKKVWPAPLRALYLNAVFPERQRLFGRAWHVRQPAGKLRDGTTLWFY